MFTAYLSTSSLDSLGPAWDWLPVASAAVCCERGQGALWAPSRTFRLESPHSQTCCIHGALHRAGRQVGFVRECSWFPGGAVVRESAPAPQRCEFDPWVGGRSKLDPWKRN